MKRGEISCIWKWDGIEGYQLNGERRRTYQWERGKGIGGYLKKGKFYLW